LFQNKRIEILRSGATSARNKKISKKSFDRIYALGGFSFCMPPKKRLDPNQEIEARIAAFSFKDEIEEYGYYLILGKRRSGSIQST